MLIDLLHLSIIEEKASIKQLSDVKWKNMYNGAKAFMKLYLNVYTTKLQKIQIQEL